jgi:hypothetical protein
LAALAVTVATKRAVRRYKARSCGLRGRHDLGVETASGVE